MFFRTQFLRDYITDEFTIDFFNHIDNDKMSGHFLERFLSVYIEHSAGNFPLWLAPTQVTIIPIAEVHLEYAKGLEKILSDANIRVTLDHSKDGFGKKVRAAKESKVPYFIVIGDKDIEAGAVTLESRDTGALGQFTFGQVLEKLNLEIINKQS
jgi:threonyl-tRNA synthetase